MQQDSNQPEGVADVGTGEGINVSPNEVLGNLRELCAVMLGDLMHRVCVVEAALAKCQTEKADALDRLATANARLASRAS